MSTEHPASPDFAAPPVVETALGIQFEELGSFRNAHFGYFHETVRDRFSVFEDAQRIGAIREAFPSVAGRPGISITSAPTVQRGFFLDGENSPVLIQLQPDRIGFNWRKREGQEYPRYRTHRPRFLSEYANFRRFAETYGLGHINPNLCEVVYVNRIFPNENEHAIDVMAAIFPGISWQSSTPWLPRPESAKIDRTYVIGDNQGRLYAEAAIGNEGGQEFVHLRMIARVLCRSEDQLEDDLDLAHDWVVQGFVSLTAATIRRERWGEKK